MITTVTELEAEVFRKMQEDFRSIADLQSTLEISQTTARNYFQGLVKNISKENLFDIADKLGVRYRISSK